MLYICLAFSNCWILFYMPHVSPRGRNKPSENKMQPYKDHHHHHLYEMTRCWLRGPGHTANPPSLCLPCTTLITAPCSRSPFLPHLLSPNARGRAAEQRNTWARPTDSCPGLMLSNPQRHWHDSCSQKNSWMINDGNLTTLILLSTHICLMMYEPHRSSENYKRLERTFSVTSFPERWGNWGSETLADFPEAILS